MVLIQFSYNAMQRNTIYFFYAQITGNQWSTLQQNNIIRQSTFRSKFQSISNTAVIKHNTYEGQLCDVTPDLLLHYRSEGNILINCETHEIKPVKLENYG